MEFEQIIKIVKQRITMPIITILFLLYEIAYICRLILIGGF
jgi:hypothetical protein